MIEGIMDNCFFCDVASGKRTAPRIVPELETEQFVTAWDDSPATPGHALILPKRHVQFMVDLTDAEQTSLVRTVIAVKKYIQQVDLKEVYIERKQAVAGTKAEAYVDLALKSLERYGYRAPEGFNDGLNDGPAGGQTVPHFHWHVMPRWQGDIEDPRGGIRHMFAGMGNYKQGIHN